MVGFPHGDQDRCGGKELAGFEYEIGREKIREYCHVLGIENPVHFDKAAAEAEGFRNIVAPPMFVVVYSAGAMGPVLFDPEVEMNFAAMVHGGQEFDVGRAGLLRRPDHDHAELQGDLREGRQGFLRLRDADP